MPVVGEPGKPSRVQVNDMVSFNNQPTQRAGAMPSQSPTAMNLDHEDFRRLGVRPNEYRLTVIRNAATRSAKTLAERQLEEPNEQVALQLSRVATSAYRLLDPRQRHDSHHRAHVGRILPNAIAYASPSNFHDGDKSRAGDPESTIDPKHASDMQLIEMLQLNPEPIGPGPSWATSLDDEDLRNSSPLVRQARHFISEIHHPWLIASLVGLVVLVMYSLATWNADPDPAPLKLGEEVETAEVQPVEPVQEVSIEPPKVTPASAEVSPALPRTESIPLETFRDSEAEATVEPVDLDAKVDVELPTTPMVAKEELTESVSPPAIEQTPPAIEQEEEVARTDAAEQMGAAEDAMAKVDPSDNGFLPDPFEQALEETRTAENQEETTPIATPNRAAPPTMASIDRLEQQLFAEHPSLSEPLSLRNAVSRLTLLKSVASKLKPGSQPYWVVSMMALETAWTLESMETLDRRADWTHLYETDEDAVLVSSFDAATESAVDEQTRARLLEKGMALCDAMLVEEAFVDCKNATKHCRELAEKLRDDDAQRQLDLFDESVRQMRRMSKTVAEADLDATDLSAVRNASVAGRYYCLFLRKWDVGLKWLAVAPNVRLANLAKRELGLADDAPAGKRIALANAWLSLADRHAGRAGQSIKLHALTMIQASLDDVTDVRQLELEKTIDEIEAALPTYLVGVDETDADASKVDASDQQGPDANIPSEAASAKTSEMSGAIAIEPNSQWIAVEYGMGAVINPDLLARINGALNQQLEQVTVELRGKVEFESDVSLQLHSAIGDIKQTIWFDDDPVVFDPTGRSAATTVPAGTHELRWRFELGKATTVFLNVVNVESGQPVAVVGTPPEVGSVRGTIKIRSTRPTN